MELSQSTITNTEIGQRIRLVRSNRGMSLLELCDQLKTCECGLLEQYESGRGDIPARHLKVVATILQMPVDFFLHEQPLMDAASECQLLSWFRVLTLNEKAQVMRLVRDIATGLVISSTMSPEERPTR